MAIDLDSIDASLVSSANLPWATSIINDDGSIRLGVNKNIFNKANFLDWCNKNLNADHIKILESVRKTIAQAEQDAIDEGDLTISDSGEYVWEDIESVSLVSALIEPSLLLASQKIYYQYAVDTGLID